MKNLEYFMALPYRIEIQPIPESIGGGYEASIPDLGKYSVCAHGETIEEAIRELQTVKEERLRSYLEEALTIPEPEPTEEGFSGKFMARIPKYLHRELSQRARQNGVSLNQYVTSLLSGGLMLEMNRSSLKAIQEEIGQLRHRIHDLRYVLSHEVLQYQLLSENLIDEEPRAA